MLDADGFGDVVAKASQKEVRDYIADQATLRLARTSNFVSAARPVVTDAVSAAIATAPVKEAIHDFVAPRARADLPGARARAGSTSTRRKRRSPCARALETINPALAKKLPPNVLDATTTHLAVPAVDLLFRASEWIRTSTSPLFLAGVGILLVVTRSGRATACTRSGRSGSTMAVAGALLLGIGVCHARRSSRSRRTERCRPRRGGAAFIDVLVGRLVGAGPGASS